MSSSKNSKYTFIGRNLKKKIDDLENKLREYFLQGDLEQAQNMIFDKVKLLIDFSNKIIPVKALPELNAQDRCNWPGGSGGYLNDSDSAHKEEFREKRWADEDELLDAENPRRIQRLWDSLKDKLEKRYFRPFKSREDFAQMIWTFKNREHLLHKISRLKEEIDKVKRFDDFSEAEPNSGWEDSKNMWNKYFLPFDISDCAEDLIGMLRDLSKSSKKLYDKNGSYFEGITYVRFLEDHNRISHSHADYFSSLFYKDKKNEFSFEEAVNLLYKEYAREAGMEMNTHYITYEHEIPRETLNIILKTLKKRYEERKPGDEVFKFMENYSKVILDRWKATAVDYEKIFDYHDPHFIDKRIMSVFWTIKEGRLYTQYDEEEHRERRLTGVLNAMLDDGIITDEQIDPPLRNDYLKENEVLSAGGENLLLGKRQIDLISKLMDQSPKLIATEITDVDMQRLALPPANTNSLVYLENDFSALLDVLNPSKKYFPIFKGKHTIFISSEEYWPNGERQIGEIHRLTLLPEGVNPKEGSVVKLFGHNFNVIKQKSYKLKKDIADSILDQNSDDLPANSYNVILGISPAEFKEKYFKDFMAHLLIHSPRLGLEELLRDLNSINNLSNVEMNAKIGDTGRSWFRSFSIGDKFAFQVKNRNNVFMEEVSFISKTLIDYIRDVGLPFHVELDLGESGRNTLKRKLENREYFRENFQSIVESVKKKGIASLLTYILNNRKDDPFENKRYSTHNFEVSSKPCEDCGKKYFSGEIYRPDLKEQWCEGFSAEDLHILHEHPNTFKFKFDNLKKIKRFLDDVGEFSPSFIKYPELLSEFEFFRKDFESYVRAYSESYGFWESTHGGINAEQEELEDNPNLKKLSDLEIKLNQEEEYAEGLLQEAALKIQKKYDELRGEKINPETNPIEITNYWSKELNILDIYRITAPYLLTSGQEKKD